MFEQPSTSILMSWLDLLVCLRTDLFEDAVLCWSTFFLACHPFVSYDSLLSVVINQLFLKHGNFLKLCEWCSTDQVRPKRETSSQGRIHKYSHLWVERLWVEPSMSFHPLAPVHDRVSANMMYQRPSFIAMITNEVCLDSWHQFNKQSKQFMFHMECIISDGIVCFQ